MTTIKIDVISWTISGIIVFFNTFIIGWTCYRIVGLERIYSKTNFINRFAARLTVALFTNTALITYILDVLVMGNVITKGGFIQNETSVFLTNALFPPFLWIIDPDSL